MSNDFWNEFKVIAKSAESASGSNSAQVCNDGYMRLLEYVAKHAPDRRYAAAPELVDALKLWARWDDMTEAELAFALEATTAALAKAGVR